MESTARKYRIQPKRDFGSGNGFLINGQWVKAGFVVTDGFCNVMPGATWFQTIADAFRAIVIWEMAGKRADEFWRLWRTEETTTMSDPTIIRIYEQTLTDGSKVFGVVVGNVTFDCTSEDEAYQLANEMDRLSLNMQFDGWDRITRKAS